MLLHFIRHGQTDFNIGRRLQGVGIDEPLNETGEKQVAELVPSCRRISASSSHRRSSAR